MDAATPLADLAGTLATLEQLPADDLPTAEALAATMSGWTAADLAAYRAAVLDEVSALGGRPVRGFLAVEVAALLAVTDHQD